jgi:methylphosphotriester-DNA--protein-cysteine methyltransferase
MKKSMVVLAGLFILSFTSFAHADFVGNKSSKLFFPDSCSFVKMIKKENVVNFKTSAEAVAAGYKASSKCQDTSAPAMSFVGNKSSKLFFQADCSTVKMIKDDNKVNFKSSQEALAAGYKASSKCTDSK